MAGMAKVVWLRRESSPPMEKAAILQSFHLQMWLSPVLPRLRCTAKSTSNDRTANFFVIRRFQCQLLSHGSSTRGDHQDSDDEQKIADRCPSHCASSCAVPLAC